METILVYRTGQLGDTVCAIPAIRAIRENFAPCKLVLMSDIHPHAAYPKAHEVLLEFGLVDDSLVYNPSEIYSPKFACDLRKQIRSHRIRRAVYLGQRRRGPMQRIRDFLFFKFCGIKYLHGLRLFNNAGDGSYGLQEAERLLDILRREKFGIPRDPSFALTSPETVKQKIDRVWTQIDLDRKKIVAVVPGSKMPVKRWGLENYKAAGTRLIEAFDVHLILLGGTEDRETAADLANTWGDRCIDLTGRTSYMESAEILRRCAFYLGNDSGAMHLAAAVGTRCVAIFSARDTAGAWYPYGTGHTVLRKRVECEGCMLTECIEQKMKCIADISVDEVINACGKYLAPSNVGAAAGAY
jgi:heptosyltransferase-3